MWAERPVLRRKTVDTVLASCRWSRSCPASLRPILSTVGASGRPSSRWTAATLPRPSGTRRAKSNTTASLESGSRTAAVRQGLPGGRDLAVVELVAAFWRMRRSTTGPAATAVNSGRLTRVGPLEAAIRCDTGGRIRTARVEMRTPVDDRCRVGADLHQPPSGPIEARVQESGTAHELVPAIVSGRSGGAGFAQGQV